VKNQLTISAILFCAVLFLTSCNRSYGPAVERELGAKTKVFYAIEMNNQLCGYKEMACSRVLTDLGELKQVTQKAHFRMDLMGKKVFTNIENESFFDTTLQQLIFSSSHVKQGKMRLNSNISIRRDTAFINYTTGQENKVVPLPAGIHYDNGIFRTDLIHAFRDDTTAIYKIEFYNEMKSTIDSRTYRWNGREMLRLGDKTYNAVCFQELNHSTGEQSELWVEEETGFIIQGVYHTSGIKYFLAEREIMNRLKFSKVDDILFYTVHEIIPDFQSLSYMKVYMVINSSGDSLSTDDLNYRGQTFSGTVTNNIIDGIFEIRQTKYDGSGAPGYPYDHELDSASLQYTEPGFLIESDNPKIQKKARGIVGSDVTDSWEVVNKLSRWVGTEIKGAIPGGGSALGTLKVMEGECGGHSRLLIAFCRSLGIPARSSVGCMYVPDNGGFFGQHMWTEVYMGEAGWIPVDATIKEFDYIDSGHIRLGEFTSFHPQEIRIMGYKTDSKNANFEKEKP